MKMTCPNSFLEEQKKAFPFFQTDTDTDLGHLRVLRRSICLAGISYIIKYRQLNI
jgi:hypothetical protein